MNTAAKRLYGKKLNPFNSETSKPSSFFKSKVERKINKQPESHLGPGQYEISLPLVKPTFQTIMKNDNTVIVKFNSHCSNAFQSKSPRFKYEDTEIQRKGNSYNEAKRKYEMQNFERNYHQNEEKLANELSRSLLISEMYEIGNLEPRISKTMKKISHKLYRQNSTKRKTISHNSPNKDEQKLESHNPQIQMQHRTLPVAYRLHNLEPNMIETKKLQSNRYNSSVKSTEWSKYKLQRKSFVDEMPSQDQPGPGTYAVKEPKFKTYNQRAEITSWQFNSKTCRSPFQFGLARQNGQKRFFNQSMNDDMGSRYKLVEDLEERERKQKILKKKISRQRLFGLLKSKEDKPEAENERNLSLEFTAIHSRENLFVEK